MIEVLLVLAVGGWLGWQANEKCCFNNDQCSEEYEEEEYYEDEEI